MAKRKASSTNYLNREKLIDFCGMVYAIDILGGRWKLLILYKLGTQTLRFTELKKRIPDITDRMLTLHLKELEKDGLLKRTVYAEVPPRVEYQLNSQWYYTDAYLATAGTLGPGTQGRAEYLLIKPVMKKQSIIFILFFLAAALKMQPLAAQLPDSVKQFLDTSLHIIENNSLHRHTVNWEKLRQEVYIRAASARTYTDILPIYPYIFEQIDDHHGALKYKDKSYGWKGRDPLTINKAVADAVNKYTAVKAVPLGKNTGYIFVPGNNDFGGGKTDSLIKCIAAAVATVHNKAITGWIIDLRANTGGNMYPMIAGLACLIGDGPIGGFITPDKQPDGTWSIRNGEMYVDTIRVSPANYNGYPVKPAIPLVVLISGYTASSGEMTAISTVGRKNSVLIGENSAGYTTVNNGFPFGKNAGLVLAVDYAADRNGTVYPVKLSPAITVTGGDNFEQPALDKKVQASLLWLNKHR